MERKHGRNLTKTLLIPELDGVRGMGKHKRKWNERVKELPEQSGVSFHEVERGPRDKSQRKVIVFVGI